MKIVIIEDNFLTAQTLSIIVTRLGHESTGVFHDADSFLAEIDSLEPELILLDITLEGTKSGMDAAKELRVHKKTRIIFISAHNDQETLDQVEAIGHAFLVSKPFNESIIKEAIDSVKASID